MAALKQYGLLDEVRGEGERRLQISDLARTILADQRPGARDRGILEAATKPRLIQEYVAKWVPHRPSDSHCQSELEFDKGFVSAAARQFLKVFDETVAYAGLDKRDSISDDASVSDGVETSEDGSGSIEHDLRGRAKSAAPVVNAKGKPLSERLQVVTTGNQLTVSAALINGREVDKLIRILQANKILLDDDDDSEFITVSGKVSTA